MQSTDKSVALYTELHKSIEELRKSIKEILDSLPRLPSVDSMLTLSSTPVRLHRKHRYSLIFLPCLASLNIDIPGIGQVPLTLEAGWTELSMPSGTEVALASEQGSISALYRCVDTL